MNARSKRQVKSLAAFYEGELEFLEQCVELDVLRLEDASSAAVRPTAKQLAKFRRLQRVCASLELDAVAGAIIVDLLERIQSMEDEMMRLKSAAAAHLASK